MLLNIIERLGYLYNRSQGVLHEGYTSFDIKQVINYHPQSHGIISTCIFGDFSNTDLHKKYILPVLENAKNIQNILPGWVIRVYVPPSIPDDILKQLTEHNCEVYIMMNESERYNGTMWRFLPAMESKPFIVYDADMSIVKSSLSIPKLSTNVKKWLQTDKPFFQRTLGVVNYIIPISAGMWGAKPTKDGYAPVSNMKELLEKYDNTWLGCDEAFLTKEIYPLFKKHSYYKVHSIISIIIPVLIIVLILILICKLTHRSTNHFQFCC